MLVRLRKALQRIHLNAREEIKKVPGEVKSKDRRSADFGAGFRGHRIIRNLCRLRRFQTEIQSRIRIRVQTQIETSHPQFFPIRNNLRNPAAARLLAVAGLWPA